MPSYAAVCVAPDGATYAPVITGGTSHTTSLPSCGTGTAAVVEVVQAVAGSDGSTGGIGVVACGGSGQPACQNGVLTGTTACGVPGTTSCTYATDPAPLIDSAYAAGSWSVGFCLPVALYVSAFCIGQVIKIVRLAV